MDEARPAKALVKFDDLARLDLRVARVLEAAEHPNADKLLILKVDLGSEQRQICAPLRNHYQPTELVGQLVIVVANLEARSMRGQVSQGLILTAREPASGAPLAERIVVVSPAAGMMPGAAVS